MKMHHRSSSSSSRRTVEFVLLILLLFQSTLGQLVSLSSATERAALFDLRSSLGLRSRDWPRKANPCSAWVGVQCRQDGRVVGINLSGLRRTRLGRLNPQFSVDSFVNLTVLAYFNASRFSLPGLIPDWFGQRLVSLQVLDLRSCSVNGTIPSTLGQLSRLSVLDLSSNFLSGSIPPSLGALSNLQRLNLSNNSISGSIPIQLGDLSRLLDLDLSLNSLSGLLPQDLRGLRSLKKMMISRNNLSGDLPVLLWSMNELVFLDVAYNNFTGILPNQSSNANVTAAVFNLSHNQFYGNLTSHIERFGFIDLSDNYVQGRVTDESRRNASLIDNCLQNVLNQKSLEECTLFYSSRGLSFDNFGVPNTTQPPEQGPKGNNNRRLAFILAGVFVGLGFVVLLVLMLILCLRSRQRRNGLGSIPMGGDPKTDGISINFSSVGEEFTYEQLVRATSDFSDSNLIKHGHSGDLFRGVFEGGISVVIKRTDVCLFKKESYTVELDLFRRASHARLVPLLGHCLEHENEKLMVYKYMPNGDLSNSLYRKTKQEDHNLQSLDWITRLKIAIGAAEGLSYLHHECNPPLVHRDVQASSILLDDKFEVRLGSLSEVCTQEGDTHQNVITRLFRLSQSSDQGPSGLVPATCAYDVYCFGKVLLELVTGKLGISASNDATMNEWLEHTLPNISIYEKELVTNIVDPSLIVDDDLLEEVWAMAVVAKSCLNPKPSKRPLMRYILKALENPSKVVREESLNSARLRTSSRGSWSASYFGSWRRSSSEIVTIPGPSNRDGANIVRPSGLAGSGLDFSSSIKRLSSSDVFPEPIDMPDIERP